MRRAMLAGLFGFSLLAGLATARPAAADVATYHFQGECFDCSGSLGQADLVVQDYTSGDILTNQNFVSFKYWSDILTFDSTDTSNGDWLLSSLLGQIPGDVGQGDFDLTLFQNPAPTVGPAQDARPQPDFFTFSVHDTAFPVANNADPVNWCAALSSDPGSASDCDAPLAPNNDYGGEYSIELVAAAVDVPEPASRWGLPAAGADDAVFAGDAERRLRAPFFVGARGVSGNFTRFWRDSGKSVGIVYSLSFWASINY